MVTETPAEKPYDWPDLTRDLALSTPLTVTEAFELIHPLRGLGLDPLDLHSPLRQMFRRGLPNPDPLDGYKRDVATSMGNSLAALLQLAQEENTP